MKDTDGRYFIQEMINAAVSAPGKASIHTYPWQNPGDPAPREKITSAIYFQPWDWVIFASAYREELLNEVIDKTHTAMNTLMWTSVFTGLVVLVFGAIAYLFLVQFSITGPLKSLMTVAKKVNDGDVLQKSIEIKSNDEIGQLGGVFNTLFGNLTELVNRSTLIAKGVIGADEVEEKMKRGMDLVSAATIQKEKSDLADSFDLMQAELRKLTIQARKIAVDDLNNPVLNIRIPGELGDAFSQMTANLKDLADVAQKIANHDLTATVKVHSDKAVLGMAFSKMAENLKGLVKSINQLASDALRSAGDMAQTTEQSNHTMADVQNSIQQIASATTQISKSAQEISVLVQNTNKVVEVGSDNIAKVIGKFNTLQDTIKNTGTSINKLEQRSQEISEIVGLITKIADQTNLLALNAAIEAARAGEAGRGFAVVADEVRKLAESSGQSADNISKIIKEIQQDTASVVASSQVSLEEGQGVLGLANKMQSGYNEIVESIKGMSQQVEHIAAIAEETASSAEEISSGAQEQTSAIAEIANNAQGMVAQAGKLKAEIDKFKV
jgi:methyl-accepting chemotaxis protein